MSNTKYIQVLHQLHTDWISALELSKDELHSFENRLQEITKANTGKDVLAQVEHFQNQFIRQREVIDELTHVIHEDELRIAENAKQNNVAVEHRKLEENLVLTEKYEMFQKIFNELRTEYIKFMSKSF